jgi:voltage-gated potassium channel
VVTRPTVPIVANRWLLRRVARPVLTLVSVVVAVFWTGETALTAAFGGQIKEELRRVKNQRERTSISEHTITVATGCSAERSREHGRGVVVEHDPAQYERALDADLLGVDGDARREVVLRDAGIDRADTLVAAIDDSNVNVQIALLATQLAPDLTVIVRVGDETYESVARHAGADDVMIPKSPAGNASRSGGDGMCVVGVTAAALVVRSTSRTPS